MTGTMRLPLPEPARTLITTNRARIDNLYLLYYRYVWEWQVSEKSGREVWSFEEKQGRKTIPHKPIFLNWLAEKWKSEAAMSLIEAVVAREGARMVALEAVETHATAYPEYVTAARLLMGWGYDGPLETGFGLHPLYGVPYLPGSSVKGVVRAWAEDVLLPAGDISRDDLQRFFGSQNKYEPDAETQRLGIVTFHDAFPTAWPALEVDVLTPHFADWYTKQDTPGDWMDPVPNYFLTVAPGTRFRFSLSISRRHEDAVDLLNQVAGWLKEALCELGVGAKTGAGYGYFADADAVIYRVLPPPEKKKREERTAPRESSRREAEHYLRSEEERRARKLRERKQAITATLDWEPGVARGKYVKARLVSRGETCGVVLAAEGHGEQVPVTAVKVPDEIAVGDWMIVEVKGVSLATGLVGEVHYVARADTPGEMRAVDGTEDRPGAAPEQGALKASALGTGRLGPFEGTVRIKWRGAKPKGTIESPLHSAPVAFDMKAAGADSSWEGDRVRFFTEAGQGVLIERLG